MRASSKKGFGNLDAVLWDQVLGANGLQVLGVGVPAVNKTTLRGKAFCDLQRAIIRGDFQPGQQLDLNQIAKEFGISMTPLKEAVALLAQYGVLEVRPRRGTSVRVIRARTIREACEARLALERWAIERYPERVRPEESSLVRGVLLQLDDVVDRLQNANKYGELEAEFSLLDFWFHSAIVGLARNQYVSQAYKSLATPLLTARALSNVPDEPRRQRLLSGQKEHRAIYRALARGDIARALAITMCHVEKSMQLSIKIVEGQEGGVI